MSTTHASILIVDDNAVNLKLMRLVLEADGLHIVCAANASEALAAIANRVPDLILMDIQLPGVSGLQLTQRLRSDPRFAHVWIVAVSAYAMRGDETKALQAGCDAYYPKPIDTLTLPDVVAGFLRRKRVAP